MGVCYISGRCRDGSRIEALGDSALGETCADAAAETLTLAPADIGGVAAPPPRLLWPKRNDVRGDAGADAALAAASVASYAASFACASRRAISILPALGVVPSAVSEGLASAPPPPCAVLTAIRNSCVSVNLPSRF
jgi:hypothetical protein